MPTRTQTHPSQPHPSQPPIDRNQTPTEDKQELERRRLLGEASAPSDIPDDDNGGEGSSSRSGNGMEHVASAPVILDDDFGHGMGMGMSMGMGSRGESLPRYER